MYNILFVYKFKLAEKTNYSGENGIEKYCLKKRISTLKNHC